MVILIILVGFHIRDSFVENSDLWNSYTADIGFVHNFNQSVGYASNSHPDIEINLKLRYKHSSLIVGDPVYIYGHAIQYNRSDRTVDSITINFQNAKKSPITLDDNGFAEGADLLLYPTLDKSAFVGETEMTWMLEGPYSPRMMLTFTNKTGTYRNSRPFETKDVAIIVHPKSEFAQLINNDVVLFLTIAAFILAIIGSLNIVFYLWYFKPTKYQKNNQKEKDTNSYSNIKNNKTQKGKAKSKEKAK